jgi:hypothetical protein
VRVPGRWGVTPFVTTVPTADTWDQAVPEWLRGRYEEVTARMRADPRHVLVESAYMASPRDRYSYTETTRAWPPPRVSWVERAGRHIRRLIVRRKSRQFIDGLNRDRGG